MLNFLKAKTPELDLDEILKEGWLSKESKYRKVWRERWCVLTCRAFQTYEKEKNYINATEIIDITKIKTIKSDDKTSSNIFKIETLEGVYQFQAKTFHDKEAWIGSIGKSMVKTSNSNLFIAEEDQ